MSASRTDFTLLAEALRAVRPSTPTEPGNDLALGKILAWEQCCIAVADAFENSNPRFQRSTFLTACLYQ